MRDSAESVFDKKTTPDGESTNDDFVRRMAKSGVGSFKEALARDVDPPEELRHVMVWYNDLRSRNPRGWNFEPVPFTEIESFRNLYQLPMDAFDVDMLVMLDGIWQTKQPPPQAR